MSASDTESDDDSTDTTAGTFSGRINSDAFGSILAALEAANDEAVFEYHDDRMVAHCVDPAAVLMAYAEAPADAFAEYEANDHSLGINLSKLTNANIGETMDMEWDTDEWRLAINSGPASARVSTINPSDVRTQQPSEKVWDGTEASWTMPYDDLQQALKVVTKPSGTALEVHAEADFIGLRKSGDTDDWDAEFENAEVIERDENVMCIQSEEYLKSIRQAIPSGVDELTVSTATDWPLIIEYTYEGVDVTFVQAPRIDNK